MGNRLATSESLYLRQHAANPIAWQPWSDEAFAEARRRDCPVFLSVGYSSCHWCHVMAHESFEDAEVAEVLNEHFVCIKVDREERPDVDETYMLAVQLASGRGGWPMSVFLDPDRRPFLAATYLPKEPRGGHPGFLALCHRVAEAWRTERAALAEAAGELAEAIGRVQSRAAPEPEVRLRDLPDRAVAALAHEFDDANGGFGDAPKFPPHTAIAFLLAYAARTDSPEGRATAELMACHTLDQMLRGGIHDHVGGGFHRYSTDAQWVLPHFEKMLVDNALMLANLASAAASGRGDASAYKWASDRLTAWLERSMRLPNGLYGTALDADSEGEEGRTYIWTRQEVERRLGERAGPFLEAYRFEEEGNFEDEATGMRTGGNIPHGVLNGERFATELNLLLQAREERPQPALDDKAVVGWNALTMGSLAKAGYLEPALRIAHSLSSAIGESGAVPRLVTGSGPSGRGFLEDHAFAAQGFSQLALVTKDDSWTAQALRIVDAMVESFQAPDGGFFGTDSSHESLLGRGKPVFDQPAPSGNAVAIDCLVQVGRLDLAERALQSLLGWMAHAPQATEAMLLASLPLIEEAPGVSLALPEPVQIRLEPSEWDVVNGKAEGRVVLSIAQGHHINSANPPVKWLVPTEVSVLGPPAEVRYPENEDLGWEGSISIAILLHITKEQEFEVVVRFQACTEDACLEATERSLSGRLRRR